MGYIAWQYTFCRTGLGEFKGNVLIIYGGENLDSDIDTDSATISSTETTTIIGGTGDRLGLRFDMGDIDANGLMDLILVSRKSGAYVLFDFQNRSLNGQTINVTDYSPKLKLKIPSDLGKDIAVTDVNKDGVDDLIVGSGDEQVNNVHDGRAYLMYGSENMPPTALDMSLEKDRARTTQILGYHEGNTVGRAVAAGDINGDGIDDIVVSGPEARTIAGTLSGEVYVIYGRSARSQQPAVAKPQLLQSFPNPFNANTAIRYRLEKAQRIRVTIYDALGKAVRRLVNGQIEAGEHRAIWNGYDDNFQQTASGVYFCHVVGETFSASIKLLFLK